MALVSRSEISRPDGPLPLQLRSSASSSGLLCSAHRSAWRFQVKTSVLVDAHSPNVPSGKKENLMKAIFEVSRKPGTGPFGRRKAVGGASSSRKKSKSHSRAWLGRRNLVESAASTHVAAALRTQKEIKWRMLENRSAGIQNQQ